MNELNAIVAIAARDITKLLRDKGRILASLIFPIIFIGVLGTSLHSNLSADLKYNFLTFVFTGVLAQTLFQSTASGMISLIEDRQNDFAQEIFISPISRYSIIIGKILGETVVSGVQVLGVVAFGLIIGIPLDVTSLIRMIPAGLIVSFLGGGFGLIVMANFGDQRSANQLFPFLLFPQFFLAGVFNPIKVLPLPLMIASRVAPMTYAVDFMRSVYYLNGPEASYTVIFNTTTNLVIITAMLLIFMSVGTYLFVIKEKDR